MLSFQLQKDNLFVLMVTVAAWSQSDLEIGRVIKYYAAARENIWKYLTSVTERHHAKSQGSSNVYLDKLSNYPVIWHGYRAFMLRVYKLTFTLKKILPKLINFDTAVKYSSVNTAYAAFSRHS